jgi:tetratricopeptide (TPR) repeat protein
MKIRATSRTAPRPAALTLVLVALALALTLGPVASPWDLPAAEASDHKAAELRARKAFTGGEYEKALDIYVDLYGETHHPTYLRNIARCHQNLGHAEKAISGFREYLRQAKNLTPEQQAEIEKYIAEMEELKRKEALAASGSSPPAPSPTRADADGDAVKASAAATAVEGARGHKSAEAGQAVPPAADRQPKPPGVDLSPHTVPAEVSAKKDNEASESSPFYTRVWFWAGVGALAAGIATTLLIVSADRGPSYGNLGHTDVPSVQSQQ